MKSTMKFFKRAKLHENTAERDLKIRELLKHLEEKVAAPLGKLTRAESARIATGTKYWKDMAFVSEALTRLSSKDMSKDGNEAAYVLAWAKFAEIMKDVGNNENALWATECNEKFITPVSTFQKDVATEQTKVLKKVYEKALEEYSAALAKLDSAHKDPKKSLDIMKVYTLEKERVRTKKLFDDAILDLEQHGEDIDERLNYEFLDMFASSMMAEDNAYKAMAGLFEEMETYLADLHGWCDDEKQLFLTHTQQRSTQRTAAHDQAKSDEMRAFAGQFDKYLVDNCRPIVRQGDSGVDIVPPLLALWKHFSLPIPDGLDGTPASLSPDAATEQVRNGIKHNFDAIGLALGLSATDRIVTLSEALANVEPFQLTANLTNSAGPSSSGNHQRQSSSDA